MFVENKIDYVDVSIVKEKNTGCCYMVKTDSPLPKDCEVVKTLKDVPMPVFDLLTTPRQAVENLRALLEDDRRAKKYLSKSSDCQKAFADIIEGK
jgi:hypothetical protein